MKRKDLLKELKRIAKTKNTDLEISHGGNHDKARIGHLMQPIPRHKEIPENLAKAIIKYMEK